MYLSKITISLICSPDLCRLVLIMRLCSIFTKKYILYQLYVKYMILVFKAILIRIL